MPSARSTLHLLFLLPFFAQAQNTPWPLPKDLPNFGSANFENPKDSADFVRFRKGLQRVDPDWTMDTTTISYRLLWRENEHGGMTLVSRGDGSVLRASRREASALYDTMSLSYRTADGRCVILHTHEVPCGLICRSTWYYVEE